MGWGNRGKWGVSYSLDCGPAVFEAIRISTGTDAHSFGGGREYVIVIGLICVSACSIVACSCSCALWLWWHRSNVRGQPRDSRRKRTRALRESSSSSAGNDVAPRPRRRVPGSQRGAREDLAGTDHVVLGSDRRAPRAFRGDIYSFDDEAGLPDVMSSFPILQGYQDGYDEALRKFWAERRRASAKGPWRGGAFTSARAAAQDQPSGPRLKQCILATWG